MGSSLNLRGGTSVAKTLVDSITQSGHGFVVADVLRYDTTTSRYRKAIANSAENSEVVGIVSAVADSNSFDLVYNGYVYLPSLSGASAPVQFLSGITAGEVTTNPPSAIGTVIKPVLTKNTSGGGYLFINYLGTQIGGSSTVAIDHIQPVGSIIPYAGGVIPETWLACDGASYAIGDYSELYSKLQYTTGSRTPMYGYVANITVGNATAYAVGQAVSQASPGLSGTVLSLNGTAAAPSGTITLTVQTIPTYSATNKNFINQNAQFVANISNNINIAGVLSTISAVANTHFNTPDLRGRFAMGVNTTTIADAETDATYQSGISNIYTLGSEGGEEQHTLSVAEMPGHGHSAPTWTGVTAVGGTYELATSYPYATNYDYIGSAPTSTVGSNTPHNNIPPYVTTQYIIKAKPYTRAAIIDGVDIPYDQLLVRDMRSESIGGVSGSDLVFYTNSGEADKLGTERMRLYNNGDLELLGDRNTSRNRLFIKSTFNAYPGQTSNDDSYLESQKQDGTPVGNFGFNGWSTQSLRYTDFQIATRGVTDTEVNRRIYIDREGNIQMGGWAGLTGGATGSNSKALTVTTAGDLYNDYQDKTYVPGVTGGALRLSSNTNTSFIANNQYYDSSSLATKRSRAGGSSTIRLWNTNDSAGSRIDFMVGGTGAKDSTITNTTVMSIDANGLDVTGSIKASGFTTGNVAPNSVLHRGATSVVGRLVGVYLAAWTGETHYSSTPIDAGVWEIHATTQENDAGDEDPLLVYDTVVTVPTGNYLTWRLTGARSTASASGLQYRFQTTASSIASTDTSGPAWTDVPLTNINTQATTLESNTITGSNAASWGLVGYPPSATGTNNNYISFLLGYIKRIA